MEDWTGFKIVTHVNGKRCQRTIKHHDSDTATLTVNRAFPAQEYPPVNHLIELAHELATMEGMTPALMAKILAATSATAEFMVAAELDRRAELAKLQVAADARRKHEDNAPAFKPAAAKTRKPRSDKGTKTATEPAA